MTTEYDIMTNTQPYYEDLIPRADQKKMIVYMVKKKDQDKWGKSGYGKPKWGSKIAGTIWTKRHYAIKFLKSNKMKEHEAEIIEFELKEIK